MSDLYTKLDDGEISEAHLKEHYAEAKRLVKELLEGADTANAGHAVIYTQARHWQIDRVLTMIVAHFAVTLHLTGNMRRARSHDRSRRWQRDAAPARLRYPGHCAGRASVTDRETGESRSWTMEEAIRPAGLDARDRRIQQIDQNNRCDGAIPELPAHRIVPKFDFPPRRGGRKIGLGYMHIPETPLADAPTPARQLVESKRGGTHR